MLLEFDKIPDFIEDIQSTRKTLVPHSRKDLAALHYEICLSAFQLMAVKNQDYSVNDSPYSNFMATEAITGVPAELLLIGRWGDKLTRLASLVSKGYAAVADESIRDTIIDSINYPVLLMGLMEYKASLQQQEPAQQENGGSNDVF